MDFAFITEHGTSIAALITAVGSLLLSQRKLSITTARSNAAKLKEETERKAAQIRNEVTMAANSVRTHAEKVMAELKTELKDEINKYEQKWIDCEERDTDNKVKIARLEEQDSDNKAKIAHLEESIENLMERDEQKDEEFNRILERLAECEDRRYVVTRTRTIKSVELPPKRKVKK